MAKRIWDKGETVDQLMHELTVGNDPVLDRHLVCADTIGSAAHARMLHRVGLLELSECQNLLADLKRIHDSGKAGTFLIPPELEDVHSAIEANLIEACGEAGRRIHTARSRNDQVILALRLYIRQRVIDDLATLVDCADTTAQRFDELSDLPMPGYTHMQPAMPSSFGLWLHAWFEGVLTNIQDGLTVLTALDSNPLGSGAGFGSSLTIDRAYVASLLGFSRVQRSFIDVNNSRGRSEERYLRWAVDIACLWEKFACDVMLYTTREFGFISLPAELTTGSSIMPQKRNPDIVELLRARPSKIRGALGELQSLLSKLPSSYNRDLQYTKEPLFRGAEELRNIMLMANLIMARFTVHRERLIASMHDELYATFDACREVKNGVPFRDAYRLTADRVKRGQLDVSSLRADFEVPQAETIRAMGEARAELRELRATIGQQQQRLRTIEEQVFLMTE